MGRVPYQTVNSNMLDSGLYLLLTFSLILYDNTVGYKAAIDIIQFPSITPSLSSGGDQCWNMQLYTDCCPVELQEATEMMFRVQQR